MKESPEAFSLVSIQFLSLAFLFLTGPVFNLAIIPFILIILGLALLGWAFNSMRKSKFHIMPEVDPHAKLVTKGPYKWVRHPMYTALLLISVGLVLNVFTLPRMVVLCVLITVLYLKSALEEKLLTKKFEGYKKYSKHTKKFIPFVF